MCVCIHIIYIIYCAYTYKHRIICGKNEKDQSLGDRESFEGLGQTLGDRKGLDGGVRLWMMEKSWMQEADSACVMEKGWMGGQTLGDGEGLDAGTDSW